MAALVAQTGSLQHIYRVRPRLAVCTAAMDACEKIEERGQDDCHPGGRGFRETRAVVMTTAFSVDRMFAKTTDKKHVA
jgi:hypothetical protein